MDSMTLAILVGSGMRRMQGGGVSRGSGVDPDPEVEVDRKTYDLPVASSSTALVRRALSQRSRGSDRGS